MAAAKKSNWQGEEKEKNIQKKRSTPRSLYMPFRKYTYIRKRQENIELLSSDPDRLFESLTFFFFFNLTLHVQLSQQMLAERNETGEEKLCLVFSTIYLNEYLVNVCDVNRN